MLIPVTMHLPYTLESEGDWIVASCDALDIHAQGKSADEAVTQLKWEMELFLEHCYKGGTLETVLRDCGFERMSEDAVPVEFPETPSDDRTVEVRVPPAWQVNPTRVNARTR